MDFFLKFTDEAAARAVLYTTHAAQTDEDGNVTAAAYDTPNFANIDVLGVIYAREVVEGEAPVAHDGWHVNVRVVEGEDSAPIESFSVLPAEPRRVWA